MCVRRPPILRNMATVQSLAQLLCFSLLLVCLLSPPQLVIATARQLSAKPGYQTFYTDASTRDKQRAQLLPAAKTSTAESTWALKVVHRDNLPGFARVTTTSSSEDAVSAALTQMLERDAARVAALTQRLQVAREGVNTGEKEAVKVHGLDQEEVSVPVVSGLKQGSGEYFARFGVGTPAQEGYFVIDTGSDLSWVQCEPCASCYKQIDPIFNPARSSSYDPVTCSDPLCAKLLIRGCIASQCLYGVQYGDGSTTIGDLIVETLTFAGNTIERIALGCGHDNEGIFIAASGLLGLGAGTLSFPSQIKQDFAYCLADRFGSGSSDLTFGSGAIPSTSAFTPLLKNPGLGTFYFLKLEGISVGGTRLSITAADFESSGIGGVILDSGTSITRLAAPAYAALRDAFAAKAADLPRAGTFSLFDTCYALKGLVSVNVPEVSLHLAGGTTLSLPVTNYMIRVDSIGAYCFGFAGTNGPSIIGNFLQQGYRVSYDTSKSRLGFAENQC